MVARAADDRLGVGGGVVGIHGTNEPWLIPGRPSHGSRGKEAARPRPAG
jgi:hypothetical protein